MNLNPKRLEGETFEEYKERRRYADKALKKRLRGHRVKFTRNELKEILK